jgi:hypothetical protein
MNRKYKFKNIEKIYFVSRDAMPYVPIVEWIDSLFIHTVGSSTNYKLAVNNIQGRPFVGEETRNIYCWS